MNKLLKSIKENDWKADIHWILAGTTVGLIIKYIVENFIIS